jgi:hypothetical protein
VRWGTDAGGSGRSSGRTGAARGRQVVLGAAEVMM